MKSYLSIRRSMTGIWTSEGRNRYGVCIALVYGLFCCVAVWCSSIRAQDGLQSLQQSLSFHASFDQTADADFARGDRSLWNAPAINQRDKATTGLPPTGEVVLAFNAGQFGGAIRFAKGKGPIVFFKADKNCPAPNANWSGTFSFWLSTDPAKDLLDGFCDPMQLTSKQWDDAAIFVEFEKRPSGIPFRLGVYADKSVWNPTNRKFETIPAHERPLTAVEQPPFAGGKWVHVAIVLERFNTGKADGIATLYLNGEKRGDVAARNQMFTWDPQKSALMLGLNYVGLMDDLAVFDRALSEQDIQRIFRLTKGVSELRPNR